MRILKAPLSNLRQSKIISMKKNRLTANSPIFDLRPLSRTQVRLELKNDKVATQTTSRKYVDSSRVQTNYLSQ